MEQSEPMVIDLRGPMDKPFGFVYPEDESYRIGFTALGPTIYLWAGNWGRVPEHAYARATATLHDSFPEYKVERGQPPFGAATTSAEVSASTNQERGDNTQELGAGGVGNA